MALVLRALARHGVTVPLTETDALAGWLAAEAGLDVPDEGPLTIAIGQAGAATVTGVPYASAAEAVVLALRDGSALQVAIARPAPITNGHNVGGEPRDAIGVDVDGFVTVADAADELIRRGAWARCAQALGALDAALEFSVAHTRERDRCDTRAPAVAGDDAGSQLGRRVRRHGVSRPEAGPAGAGRGPRR